MALSDEDVDDVLEAISSHYTHSLTDWEDDFVHSVTDQWGRQRTLTPRQRTKLEEIWDEFASGRRS